MAKEFGFEDRLRKRSTAYLNERAVLTATVKMYSVCYQLFACTTLSLNQYCRISLGYYTDEFIDFTHFIRFTHEVTKLVLFLQTLTKIDVLVF